MRIIPITYLMKTSFTFFFSLILLAVASAQITVERSDFLYAYGDTSFLVRFTSVDPIPAPAAGEDVLWDYSNLPLDTATRYFIPHEIAYSGNDLPGANGVDVVLRPIDIFPGALRPLIFYTQLDDTLYQTVGNRYLPISIPIGGLTTVATDSLKFLNIINNYVDDPAATIKFPIVYNPTPVVHSNTVSSPFLLTATPFNLQDVPGDIVSIVTDTTAINGWGTLRITDPLSNQLLEIPALLRSKHSSMVDSFFLGGMPAPPSILGAFNQTQGQLSNETLYQFFGEGFTDEIGQLLNDGDTTRMVANTEVIGYIASQLVPAAERLAVSVYPNPASGMFTLTFPKTQTADWSLTLLNFNGQVMHRQRLSGSGDEVSCPVWPARSLNGPHAYLIRDENGYIIGSGKVLLE